MWSRFFVKSKDEGKDRTEEDERSVEKNDNGMAELILSILDKISFGTADEDVTDHLPNGDLRLAWERLCNKFEPRTTSRLTDLKFAFFTSKHFNTV